MIENRERVQRIGVGDQVTTHAIRIDQLDDPSFFQRLLVYLIAGKKERIAVDVPAQGRVRNAEIQEDVFIKVVLADQELVYAREKPSRLRALNDSVIVSAADRNRLADAEL